MASILDCAILSEDVYNRSENTLARSAGWTRRDPVNWAFGFAAGRYDRPPPGDETVVAFRGTDIDPDWDDILSDAMMVPTADPGQAAAALRELLEAYGVAHEGHFAVAPEMFDRVMQSSPARLAVRRYANRIPPEQVQAALQYFDATTPRPSTVVGHSLGGALAKIVSQERGVPAVAFNSPYMGALGGVSPTTSGVQISVNADRDPLSFATRAIGNLPHGEVIEVAIAPVPDARPRTARRPVWGYLVFGLSGLAARELEFQMRRHRELLDYVLACALHYHSMENLRRAVSNQPRFREDLAARFGRRR